MEQNYQKMVDELGRTMNRVFQLYAKWARKQGVGYHTLAVLYTAYQTGGCTQKYISEDWILSKQTVNTVCRELHAQGYVILEPGQQDRREKLVRLTEAGKQYAVPLIEALEKTEHRVMEQMGEEARAWLTKSCRMFCQLLEAEVENE
ncbi:MAG: MarR family winged helix-turn-helix transcriptional regulator [Butyricicoccaceae bacterium]